MKASFEAVPKPSGRSFLVRSFGREGFDAPFHYHPEIELTLITKGKGLRYIGTQMSQFEEGDMVLISSNVPHCWKLDENFTEASSIVIQFNLDFLGEAFKSIPELKNIYQALHDNTGAILVHGLLHQYVSASLSDILHEENELDALLKLIKTLYFIASSEEVSYINTKPLDKSRLKNNHHKLIPVFEYIQNQFTKDISLPEAARIADMNINTFCKFFKKTTRKTFYEMVTDYRINLAIQLLTSTGCSIAQVSEECGFSDPSNLFKVFKARTGLSPRDYRNKYRDGIVSWSPESGSDNFTS